MMRDRIVSIHNFDINYIMDYICIQYNIYTQRSTLQVCVPYKLYCVVRSIVCLSMMVMVLWSQIFTLVDGLIFHVYNDIRMLEKVDWIGTHGCA